MYEYTIMELIGTMGKDENGRYAVASWAIIDSPRGESGDEFIEFYDSKDKALADAKSHLEFWDSSKKKDRQLYVTQILCNINDDGSKTAYFKNAQGAVYTECLEYDEVEV